MFQDVSYEYERYVTKHNYNKPFPLKASNKPCQERIQVSYVDLTVVTYVAMGSLAHLCLSVYLWANTLCVALGGNWAIIICIEVYAMGSLNNNEGI